MCVFNLYYTTMTSIQIHPTNIKSSNNKNAIVMLCMLNEKYVTGACISAYAHRSYIKILNANIDLVCMCDEYIYEKWGDILNQYFDVVEKIKLISFDWRSDYETVKKYNWMNYSINKWHCLKLVQYNKILFVDIDVLPNSIKFYDLMGLCTPAFNRVVMPFRRHELKPNMTEIGKQVTVKIECCYNDYVVSNFDKYGSIDGGICLLSPSNEIFDEYIAFITKLYKDGIYSNFKSGPDETSLFYFYTSKMPIYIIPIEFAVIPWDMPQLINCAVGLNFLSYIKPWIKPRGLQWDEEQIWRDLFEIMPKCNELIKFNKYLLEKIYYDFNDLLYSQRKKWFNMAFTKIINTNNYDSTIFKSRGYGMIKFDLFNSTNKHS